VKLTTHLRLAPRLIRGAIPALPQEPDNSLNIVTEPRNGRPGSIPVRGSDFFAITSRLAVGLTQPPIKLAPGALSQRAQRVGREANRTSM
jgi:hypothetical protein